MATRTRSTSGQSEHDQVIAARAQSVTHWAQQNGYRVDTNPGGQKNRSVRERNGVEHYPDLVYWKPATSTVDIVEEVETEESVNDDEAKTQWASYQGLARFGVIVPKGRGEAAKAIAARNGVSLGYVVEYFASGGGYSFETKA